jgi:DNA polymerase-1
MPKEKPAQASAEKPRLVLFDGHGIIHRAYHAFPEPLTVRRTGEVVTAVYGFANTLLTVLDQLKPTHVAVAMDPPGKTFRHEKDVTYKATRVAAPEDLKPQFGRVRELVEAFNIPIYMKEGFEADDALGTLAKQAEAAGIETYIVTLDSDMVQLVRDDRVKLFMMRPYQRDTVVYNEDSARERYGIEPAQMPDFKGLKGDVSDNIPGVPGIGDKTATKLIEQFGSIENLYAHIGDVTPEKLRENLRAHEADARHSKEMATIHCEGPFELDLDLTQLKHYDRDKVAAFFLELDFKSLLTRLPPSPDGAGNGHRGEAALPKSTGVTKYATIYSEKDLDALAKTIAKAKAIAIDTETTEPHALRCALVGIAVSWAPGEAAYIPIGHRPALGEPEQLSEKAVVAELKPVLENAKIEKSAHNLKFDSEVLASYGAELEGAAFDTMIAAYLMNEGGGESVRPGGGALGLKWLAAKRLNVDMTPITDLIGTGAKQITMADVPVEQAAPYACADADVVGQLRPQMEADLKEQGLWKLFSEIEMPLVPVLARMERAGVAVDTDALRDMSKGLTKQIARLEKEAYDSVGHEFNLGSPQQLSQVLFEDLQLPKTRRTKQGYTTDASALEGLRGAHALIDILLEWRQLTKLKGTYIDALPALVHKDTGRIHTNFNQTVAATGRLSSQDPNLQNIPVRTDLGNAIRRCFVARDFGPKPILIAADYSQIELRIMAHLSQDPALIEAFVNDEDIHAATAAQVFGCAIEDVTPDQRRRAKVFNFGVLYGLSEFGLSAREGISREESREFIDRYFAKYAKVQEWRERTIAECRKSGYVETMVGRKRLLPEIRSSNFQVRSAAERMAINMPVQGTASDIIKIAMNRIDAELTKRAMTTKMILQVHDELIFEGPEKERKDVQELVLRVMPQSLDLAVPLKVDVKIGRNWGELELMPPVASASD